MDKADGVIAQFSDLKDINLPRNKSETTFLKRSLRQATSLNPLEIYVGSCPDYSHDGSKYTHESLGDGVPLLTKYHLEATLPMLKTLDRYDISYKYKILLADVEAIDEVFCERFTNGSEILFLQKCMKSIEASKKEMIKLQQEHGLKEVLQSSSFFAEFGREKFIKYQNAYQDVLSERYEINGSFQMRVIEDLIYRGELYKKMYPEIFESNIDRIQRKNFLIGRTLRTMAQYLTLGRLISEVSQNPIIICHPTVNIGMFNDRNKILLPGDRNQPQATIPVFEMKKEVY